MIVVQVCSTLYEDRPGAEPTEITLGTLQFVGQYSDGQFALADDGNGGTNILLDAPQPRTVQDVLRDAIQQASAHNVPSAVYQLSDMEIARTALANIINQRDVPGNSTDTVLRDAEYELRNYIGARVARGSGENLTFADWYDDVLFQNPVATGAYNAWKWLTNLAGVGSINQANPGHPNSNPGGWDASVNGWWLGIEGQPLDTLYNGSIAPSTSDGASPSDDIAPIPMPLGSTNPASIFVANVNAGSTYYFASPLSNALIFDVDNGPGITSITIPQQSNWAAPINIGIGNQVFEINPGDYFGFSQAGYGSEIYSFSIMNLPSQIEQLQSLTFGLTFSENGIVSFGDEPSCYTSGTLIKSQHGEVLVEKLRSGDLVQTVLGKTETSVIWIGHHHIDCRRHPNLTSVWPVRISVGAFESNLPCRDLFLSPDHAVFVDHVLIPIKHLINGTTITQAAVDEVTYYHIELDHHDVLLAEGLPAESYLDTGDRSKFGNGSGTITLFPDFSSHSMDATAISEAFGCAPLIVAGPKLQAVRKRLDERAGVLKRQDAA